MQTEKVVNFSPSWSGKASLFGWTHLGTSAVIIYTRTFIALKLVSARWRLQHSVVFVSWIFLSTSTRKGTNIFKGPTNLKKFHRRKRDKSCLEDPYFLRHKTLRNGIELRQDPYLSMRKFSSLSPLAIFPMVFSFRLTSFSDVEGL